MSYRLQKSIFIVQYNTNKLIGLYSERDKNIDKLRKYNDKWSIYYDDFMKELDLWYNLSSDETHSKIIKDINNIQSKIDNIIKWI